MPLLSASNETQARYCAMMFLGIPLKIAGRRPAIFQIEFFKKGNLLQKCPWLVLQMKYSNVRYLVIQVTSPFQPSLISSVS